MCLTAGYSTMAVIVVKCCVVFAKYYIFYHVIFMPSFY